MPETHPASPELERIILGSLLLDPDKANHFTEVAILEPEDFVVDWNKRLFRVFRAIQQKNLPITITSVWEESGRGAESPFSLPDLVDLFGGLPVMASIEPYVRKVKDLSRLRKLAVIGEHAMNQALQPGAVLQAIQDAMRSGLKSTSAGPINSGIHDAASIIRAAGGIEKFLEGRRGLQSQWRGFNRATGGWQASSLIIIAGRPSMGKTAFCLNALWHCAQRGKPSIFYSYEMSTESVLQRLLAMITGVSCLDIQAGQLVAQERPRIAEALTIIQESPFQIVPAAGMTMQALTAHAMAEKQADRLAFCGIDYIGLIPTGNRENRNQELGAVCRQLKGMAMQLEIPVIVLSQLNRGPEQRKDAVPNMGDLRDSGELEEHADLIGFLYRPGYYHREDRSIERMAQLIISKHRNGDTPTLDLDFRRETGVFSDIETE